MVDYPITQNVGLGSDGKFTGGDPSTGESASRLSAAWMNAVTDELLNVVRAAGLNPDEMDSAQLLAAIRKLVWSPDQIPNIDMDKVSTGYLPIERIKGILPENQMSGISFDHFPVGSWVYWLDITPPTSKWTVADGRQILIDNYPEYFTFATRGGSKAFLSIMREMHGNENAGYIYVPDLTEFARGGTNNVGVWHRDEIRNITGRLESVHNQMYQQASGRGAIQGVGGSNVYTWNPGGVGGRGFIFDASKVVPTGPKNVPEHRTWLPIIKIAS